MSDHKKWLVDRSTIPHTASWQEYRIVWYPQADGSGIYWAYTPTGRCLLSGGGDNAAAFRAICEEHAAGRYQ